IFGQRSAFEKTESGAAMEFDIHGSRLLLIVISFQKPSSAEPVMNQAIQRNMRFSLHSDIPLVPRPSFLFPPIPGGAPRPGRPQNVALNLFAANYVGRLAMPQSDSGSQRWTENAQSRDGAA